MPLLYRIKAPLCSKCWLELWQPLRLTRHHIHNVSKPFKSSESVYNHCMISECINQPVLPYIDTTIGIPVILSGIIRLHLEQEYFSPTLPLTSNLLAFSLHGHNLQGAERGKCRQTPLKLVSERKQQTVAVGLKLCISLFFQNVQIPPSAFT